MSRDIAALIRFLDSRQLAPHAWGREANDCVAFVLAAVEAQTGERIAPDVNWTSRAGALRALKGFASLEAAFDAYFDRVPPALAARGDIAGVPDPDLGIHPMIVEGMTLVAPGDRGNRRAPRRAMICAWSVETRAQPR